MKLLRIIQIAGKKMKEALYPLQESKDVAEQFFRDRAFRDRFMGLCQEPLFAKNEDEYAKGLARATEGLISLLGKQIPNDNQKRFDVISLHTEILKDLLYGNLVPIDVTGSFLFTPDSYVGDMEMFRSQIQQREIEYLVRLPQGRKKDWRINYLARSIIRMQLGYQGNFTDTNAAFQLISLKAQIRNRIQEEGDETVGYGHS